ncbi:blue-light-activated protein [bacterium BMS3Abin06]|nr:blue-light-activated protein [bacterium BMS3Abin06]HDZ02208.1 response regulator [Nitrospirota bacterium]
MKILIVDDNEDSRMILRKTLEHNRHSVQAAPNGVEAIKMAKKSPPDMIISDILMPEMDGFRLCREVKKDKELRKIPFIFYTATYVDPEDERLAISLGASCFIVKPVETGKFHTIINEVISEYKEAGLDIPARPLEEEHELSKIYENSIVRKLDQKIKELKLYKEIFINANDALAIINPEGFYIRQNSAHRALIGYTDEELQGKTPATHLGEEVFSNIAKKLYEQGVYRGELISYTKDRKVLYIELSAYKIANEKGRVSCYVWIIRDISARKRSENALRLSEEKFSKAFRSSPILIAICTLKEGRFIDVNDAFLEVSGYSREEVIGQTSSGLGLWTGPEERARVFDMLRSRGIVNNQEVKFRIKSGNILTVLLSAEKIDIEGETSIIVVAQDISERKKLENQLIHSQKMEAVGQLAGGIAHDFNNILSAIINYAYLIKMRIKEEDPSRDNIEQILALSGKASEITRGLLTFSRKNFINPIPLNLNNSVMNMEKLLTKFIGEDIRINIKLTENAPVIMADSAQIEQIIINLATNARDAMPDGGILTIETEIVELDSNFIKAHNFGSPGMYALLSVSDTGTGMDEETKQKIFEPFFTTKETGKGTGLGLAIIYGIVKQHNGYITVYSEAGKGSTFKIYFRTVTAVVEKKKEAELPDLSGDNETILLAEDSETVRKSIKNILEEFNYKAIEAVDGDDAVEKFIEHKDKIKLLILDVIMPGKNGKETLEEIREITPEIKAIFTSGYTAEIMEKKGLLKEGFNFVAKPILPDLFLKKIKDVFHGGFKD